MGLFPFLGAFFAGIHGTYRLPVGPLAVVKPVILREPRNEKIASMSPFHCDRVIAAAPLPAREA
jgi:hypothetical protein